MLPGLERRLQVSAGRVSTLLRVSSTALQQVTEAHTQMLPHLAAMTSENMRLAIATVSSLRLRDPPERVASCLLRQAVSGPGWNNSIPIRQAGLASIACISRRRVISALHEPEEIGAVSRPTLVINLGPELLLHRTDARSY